MIRRLLCLIGFHDLETILSFGCTEHVRCRRCGLRATVHVDTHEVIFR